MDRETTARLGVALYRAFALTRRSAASATLPASVGLYVTRMAAPSILDLEPIDSRDRTGEHHHTRVISPAQSALFVCLRNLGRLSTHVFPELSLFLVASALFAFEVVS